MVYNSKELITKLNSGNILMGDVKKIAKEIKRNHELSITLWKSEFYFPRLLSILILDKNMLDQNLLNKYADDIEIHSEKERNQIFDWLMANQLMKSLKLKKLIENWEYHSSPALRRLYWYYQARLRWTGKIPVDNADKLLKSIEKSLQCEEPEVQWAMNFCAGWIGIHDLKFRQKVITIGEVFGLYKDESVPKGCTPNYLPEFIRIESNKIKSK